MDDWEKYAAIYGLFGMEVCGQRTYADERPGLQSRSRTDDVTQGLYHTRQGGTVMTETGPFGSTMLEVAIGLFFVYLLLSLICSSINEIIASVFKWRAQNLEDGIRNLVCDPEMFTRVMSHPLVKAMGSTRTEVAPVQEAAGQSLAGKPSYVPSRVFAAALLDGLVPDSGTQLSVTAIRQKALDLLKTDDEQKKQIGGAVAALISETTDPQRLANRLDEIKGMVAKLPAAPNTDEEKKLRELLAIISPARTVNEIKDAVSAILPESEIREHVLKSLENVQGQITDIECELSALHKNIARWYDDAMDRVTGAYKRKIQTWLLGIAALVSIFLGVDSLRIVNNLSINPALRAAIVEEAVKQTGPGGTLVPGGASQGAAPQAAAPGATTPSPSPAGVGTAPAAPTGAQTPDLGVLVQQLAPFSALFGYSDMPATSVLDWLKWFVWRILGTTLTVFAVSLGAPFWFDVLSKVANLRGAGKRPEPIAEPVATVVAVAT